MSVDLEHVHTCLDVGQWDVDSLLESADEGLVKDPWFVRRSDEVDVEFFVLVQNPVHFLQELVPDTDFSADLFSSNSHLGVYLVDEYDCVLTLLGTLSRLHEELRDVPL